MSRKGCPNRTNVYELVIVPNLDNIRKWIISGMAVRDICSRLNISVDSWYRYCNQHEALSELVKLSRNMVNSEVENSLVKLCLGYEYEEIKTVIEEDKDGKKRTRIEKTKKQQPPSAHAISFWLRNRAPNEWSDRRELVVENRNEDERKKRFIELIDENDIIDVDFKDFCEEDKSNKI